MKGNILRKILVILIIVSPVISYSGCKKQAKCGCGKDVIKILTNERANVFFTETGSSIYFYSVNDPYSQYNLCNPSEIFAKLKNYKTGDELLVSGNAYWDCNYLYQAGNSSYVGYTRVYNVQVTDIFMNLYGKK